MKEARNTYITDVDRALEKLEQWTKSMTHVSFGGKQHENAFTLALIGTVHTNFRIVLRISKALTAIVYRRASHYQSKLRKYVMEDDIACQSKLDTSSVIKQKYSPAKSATTKHFPENQNSSKAKPDTNSFKRILSNLAGKKKNTSAPNAGIVDLESLFNSRRGPSLDITQESKEAPFREYHRDTAHESQPARYSSPSYSSHGNPKERYLLGHPYESPNYPLPDQKQSKIVEAFFHLDSVIAKHLNELTDK